MKQILSLLLSLAAIAAQAASLKISDLPATNSTLSGDSRLEVSAKTGAGGFTSRQINIDNLHSNATLRGLPVVILTNTANGHLSITATGRLDGGIIHITSDKDIGIDNFLEYRGRTNAVSFISDYSGGINARYNGGFTIETFDPRVAENTPGIGNAIRFQIFDLNDLLQNYDHRRLSMENDGRIILHKWGDADDAGPAFVLTDGNQIGVTVPMVITNALLNPHVTGYGMYNSAASQMWRWFAGEQGAVFLYNATHAANPFYVRSNAQDSAMVLDNTGLTLSGGVTASGANVGSGSITGGVYRINSGAHIHDGTAAGHAGDVAVTSDGSTTATGLIANHLHVNAVRVDGGATATGTGLIITNAAAQSITASNIVRILGGTLGNTNNRLEIRDTNDVVKVTVNSNASTLTASNIATDGGLFLSGASGRPQFTVPGSTNYGMRVASDRVDFWINGQIPATVNSSGIDLAASSTWGLYWGVHGRIYRDSAGVIALSKDQTSTPTGTLLTSNAQFNGSVNISNNLWVANDVSAATFTDRSTAPDSVSNAVAIVRSMKPMKGGRIDHSKLHPLAWGKRLEKRGTNLVEVPDQAKRDLSMTISALSMVVADQQERLDSMDKQIAALWAALGVSGAVAGAAVRKKTAKTNTPETSA